MSQPLSAPPAAPRTSSWPRGWRRPKALSDWAFQAVYVLGYLVMAIGFWVPGGNHLMLWAGGVFALGGVLLGEFMARCENRTAVHIVQAVLWGIWLILTIRQHNRERREWWQQRYGALLQQPPQDSPVAYDPLRYGDRK